MSDAKQGYRCDGCQTIYIDISDANDCCGYTEGWLCSSCENFYDNEEDAEKCCTRE